MTRLPSRLMYLSPVLDRLEALPPDDLNEETDMTDLDEALRQRFQGINPATARSELDKDRQVLGEWLYKPGMEDSAGHFMLGWLAGSDPADWEPEERTKLDEEDILENTERLRTDPEFEDLRAAIGREGVAPSSALLAVFLEDGDGNEYGVLVTVEKRVFEYERQIRLPGRKPRLMSWKDRTEDRQFERECPQVCVALGLAKTR